MSRTAWCVPAGAADKLSLGVTVMPTDLPDIRPSDALGRRVRSTRRAERLAIKNKSVPDIFCEKRGVPSLSVDRLDHAPDQDMTVIADQEPDSLGRSFLGWAVVRAEQAQQDGRTVLPDATLVNRYHASIDLNIRPDVDHWAAQKGHSNALASYAIWRERA